MLLPRGVATRTKARMHKMYDRHPTIFDRRRYRVAIDWVIDDKDQNGKINFDQKHRTSNLISSDEPPVSNLYGTPLYCTHTVVCSTGMYVMYV
jgi:hypothetical protein